MIASIAIVGNDETESSFWKTDDDRKRLDTDNQVQKSSSIWPSRHFQSIYVKECTYSLCTGSTCEYTIQLNWKYSSESNWCKTDLQLCYRRKMLQNRRLYTFQATSYESRNYAPFHSSPPMLMPNLPLHTLNSLNINSHKTSISFICQRNQLLME